MTEPTGPVFQEPGRARKASADRVHESKDRPNSPATMPAESFTVSAQNPEPVPAGDSMPGPSPKGPRRKRQRRESRRYFPVETISPHPAALEQARRLIEANPSYTRIELGDVPGSVVIR